MKRSLSKLSALAAAYLPEGFKNVQLDMAAKIDDLENRLNQLEKGNK